MNKPKFVFESQKPNLIVGSRAKEKEELINTMSKEDSDKNYLIKVIMMKLENDGYYDMDSIGRDGNTPTIPFYHYAARHPEIEAISFRVYRHFAKYGLHETKANIEFYNSLQEEDISWIKGRVKPPTKGSRPR